jgi:hypothetical protein
MIIPQQNNAGIQSLYLDRNTFMSHSASLVDNLRKLWTNDIALDDQIQYICPNG